ncbi:hypothetical protein BMS3Abin07_00261 [bacterium BMS3Abin07]|nr:hypothetical protein BMS3Abin07_00261 [bacterium BMS3Abin07]GBE32299.1 hypothetical protein BMS3Bbin05_01209 [bacterium BMS3Bbin05]
MTPFAVFLFLSIKCPGAVMADPAIFVCVDVRHCYFGFALHNEYIRMTIYKKEIIKLFLYICA